MRLQQVPVPSPACRIPAVLAAILALVAVAADAAQVQDRADMAGTDLLDWSQIPYVGIAQGFYASLDVLTNAGQPVAVSVPSTFWRTEQGSAFPANFASGEAAIASGYGGESNTATLAFDAPMAGVGAQFANTVYYGPFTAVLEVFDSTGALLESHQRSGTTTGAADGSAIFLGVLRGQNDIARAEFSVLPYELPGFGSFTRFAINQVSMVQVSAVPEPAAAVLALLGVPLVLWARRRQAHEQI